jgi:uncharacterized protein YoxC
MKTIGQTIIKTVANLAATYAQGIQIGAVLAITSSNETRESNSILLQQLNLIDSDKLGKKLKLQIFDAAIVDVGDGVAVAPTAAEFTHLVDEISIAATDWDDKGAATVAIYKNLALTVASGTSRKFYVLVKADESLTFTHVNALSIKPTFYSE